jgi:hypothetical protein
MPNEAEAAIKSKISEVESEQGSLKEAGSEPPENFGHGSVASAGTAGNLMPGGGEKK